jgi:hypothetical protein
VGEGGTLRLEGLELEEQVVARPESLAILKVDAHTCTLPLDSLKHKSLTGCERRHLCLEPTPARGKC